MKDFKYTISFSSSVKPLVTEEKDAYLALAALQNIGDFIPDIDTDRNIDLLPVAFNAFVANRVNKNGDVINTSSALDITQHFINKPINIEHNRDRIIGSILTAGFSEFGTDNPLSYEEVKDMSGPFNVTLGGVVWRSVNSELADLIEDSSDPTSDSYLKVSASWELGFSDFNLVVSADKNIDNAEFISDSNQISELSKNLKAFGGNGLTEDGKFIYRHVVGEIFPLGIGLTETPAADVEGVLAKRKDEGLLASTPEKQSLENNISQAQDKNVINTNKSKDKVMKIDSIKDITDESLKELSASAISDFIENELKEASEKFAADKRKVEDALEQSEEKYETLSKESEEMKTNVDAIQGELETLKAEKLERERQEAFNQRMSQMDEKYELTDEDREVIASDIKDMATEDFDAYLTKMAVLLSSKDREAIAKASAEAEEATAAKEEEANKEIKAEESAEEVVDEVLSDEEVNTEVPVSTAAEEPTVYDKYKAAFSMDGFDIK